MNGIKSLKYDDDLARTMVDWHLKQSTNWLGERLERVTVGERDILLFEFKADCTAATTRLERRIGHELQGTQN